jgi:membrane protein
MGKESARKTGQSISRPDFLLSEVMYHKPYGFGQLLRHSLIEMRKNDPLRMAGATAFFTTFALPPILIILFQLLSLFLNSRMVGQEMVQALTDAFGKDTANQIRVTTRGFRTIANNWYLAAGGFIFLIFVATTLFSVIKNSLNDIWKVSVKEKPGVLFYMSFRARSIGVILLMGILFLISILLDGFEVLAGDYIDDIFSGGGSFFTGTLNEITGAVVSITWFILLFRFLADARPSWKVAIAGGVLTGILFTMGKALLSYLMKHSNIATIYGASGSLVLLLLFVFYSSFILYYGASFIKVYSGSLHQSLRLMKNSFHYKVQKTS